MRVWREEEREGWKEGEGGGGKTDSDEGGKEGGMNMRAGGRGGGGGRRRGRGCNIANLVQGEGLGDCKAPSSFKGPVHHRRACRRRG